MNLDIKKILNYNLAELIGFIQFEAGLSNPNFGGVVGGKHNLKLQQVPNEYARLLIYLKEYNAKSYLELGIGQGGSFLLNTLFQPTTKICHAVDNCDYQVHHAQFSDQTTLINSRIKYLQDKNIEKDIKFINNFTDKFFKENTQNYDVIFIDADHSYDGVKKDFLNAIKILNKSGILIFHDINNTHTGVKKLWDELESDKKIKEIIFSTTCGIGIYKPN